MVQLDSFYVSFDQEWAVYRPGDLLSGSVTLATSERVYGDEVRVTLAGSGRVLWVEKELRPPSGLLNVPYSAEQSYFSHTITLWQHQNAPKGELAEEAAARDRAAVDALIKEAGSFGLRQSAALSKKEAAERPFLPPGRYVLPFSFQLPDSLPTSFESSSAPGWIRYSAKAAVVESARPKHTRKAFFTVLRPADLAVVNGAAQPFAQHFAIPLGLSSGLLCCMSGQTSLGLMLSLQKSGYVAGERLLLAAELENQASGKTIEVKLRLRLEQVCAAFASTPDHKMKETSTTLASTSSIAKVRGGTVFHWEPSLLVPALVPSFVEVELMEVSYQLVVELFAVKTRPVLAKAFPLLIGTSPVLPGLYQPPQHPAGKTKRRGGGARETPETVHEVAPPSYEESVGGREVASDPQENFLPQYPVFHNLPTPQSPALN